MRIVSYNILNGGEGRADPLAEVLLAQRADIVALVEAENLAVVERIAGRLDMDFIHAPGNRHASAILSRWPIVETINHALLNPPEVFSRSFVEARIAEPSSAPGAASAERQWTVAALHLHPHHTEADEQRRQREIDRALEVFAPQRSAGRPHLLVGDFNSNSPHQRIDLDKARPSTRKAWQDNGGTIPRRVVQSLADAGYLDSLYTFDPERGATGVTFTTRYPGQRLDYIFTFGIDPLRLTDAWIEQDRLATYASDHYPVGLEIRD